MKVYYFLFFLLLFVFCCTQQKTKSNRTSYFEDGNIKEKWIYDSVIFDSISKNINIGYLKSKKIDSTRLEYFQKPNNKLKKIDFYFDNETYFIEVYDSGKIKVEGLLKNGLRVGKWKKYAINGITYISELRIINGKSFVNQGWAINKDKDTIGGYSYDILYKDTIKLNETLKVLVYLQNSWYKNKKTKIMACISASDTIDFNEDFSNSDEFNKACSYDIETNKVNEKFINVGNYNRASFIHKDFKSPGKKLVRGIIYEYLVKEKDSLGLDKALENAHKMYFEIPVFVKDSI